MTQQEKEYTWDDLANAIGQDFSGGDVRVGADDVERGAIRRFCEPIEFDCPLHHDDEVAKRYGYKGIIAPPSSIYQPFAVGPIWQPGDKTRWPTADYNQAAVRDTSGGNAPPLPAPKTTAGFVTDVEVEYFTPVYVGDRLTTSGRKLVSVNVRKTSVGYGAFTVFETEIRNQRGELVAALRNGSYAYNPVTAS